MKPARDTHAWPETFAVLDIESDNWVDVLCICVVDTDGQRKVFEPKPGRSAEDQVIDWLFGYGFMGEYVYAHWGGRYDFLFLIPKLHKRRFAINAFMSASQVIIIEAKSPDGVKLTFVDSGRLLPDSVEKLGKSLGLPKLDADREHAGDMPRDQLLEYCFRDCDIVLKGLLRMREVFTADGFDYANTLASMVTRRVRLSDSLDWDRFYERDLNNPRRKVPNQDFARADKFAAWAYSGGRTEVFAVGRILAELPGEPVGYLYDLTSAYPWAMTHELPAYFREFRPGPALDMPLHAAFLDTTGKTPLPNLFGWPENSPLLPKYLKACGVSQAWVRIPMDSLKYPLLFVRDETSGKLLFPEGQFSGVWTNIELLALYEHMKDVPGFRMFITGQAVYEPKAFMRPLIESLWKRRQEALTKCVHCGHDKHMHGKTGCSWVNCECEKFEPDEFRAYAYKIAMNSASGKLAEQSEKSRVLMGGAARIEMRKLAELEKKERRELQARKPLLPKYSKLTVEEQETERKKLREYFVQLGIPNLRRRYTFPNNILHTRIPGVFTMMTEAEGPFRHAAAAAYVTAMTRIKLWRAFIEAERQGAQVLYCDTDSVIVTKPIFGTEPTEKALGSWNLEAVLTELEIWAPKVYRYTKAASDTVWKAKGMPIMRRENKDKPEESEKLWEQYTSVIKGTGLEKPEKGGIESLTMRIAAGDLTPTPSTLKRQLQNTDSKRKHYAGDSRPLFVRGKANDYDYPSGGIRYVISNTKRPR